MKKLNRDETDHANYYYEASEVDTRITELEALRKDAERLDFMLENSAFMVAHHGNRWQCQTQDLDENYIVLSGIGCSYLTEREAIDAAISKDAQLAALGEMVKLSEELGLYDPPIAGEAT